MEINNLIKKVIGETVNFPVLFFPIFLIYFLMGLLVSDTLATLFGQGGTFFVSLLIQFLLVPAASGVTIFLDRRIHSGKTPDIGECLEEVRPKYSSLIGVNLAAKLAIIFGLFLFIIPGIFLYVKFIFSTQEVLLGEKTSLAKALESSWNHTNNLWWTIFQIILILQVPLFLLTLSLTGLPPGWGVTFTVLLFTVFQTWLTLVVTHLYSNITRKK